MHHRFHLKTAQSVPAIMAKKGYAQIHSIFTIKMVLVTLVFKEKYKRSLSVQI